MGPERERCKKVVTLVLWLRAEEINSGKKGTSEAGTSKLRLESQRGERAA